MTFTFTDVRVTIPQNLVDQHGERFMKDRIMEMLGEGFLDQMEGRFDCFTSLAGLKITEGKRVFLTGHTE